MSVQHLCVEVEVGQVRGPDTQLVQLTASTRLPFSQQVLRWSR